MDAEVRAHELLLADEKIRAGMNPQEARRQARLELGGVEQVKEQVREIRAGHVLETLFQDVRFGLRMLRKSPGFTAVAVLTFALGIGANAAIFSFVNAIVLRPLPFGAPSRLVTVLDTKPSNEVDWLFVSPNRFEEFVRRSRAFDQIAGAENCYFRLESGDTPILVQGGCASASFFPMLGLKPFLGRLFTPEEDRLGGNPVAVLSYSCWKQYFGGDPGAIGKTIHRTANDAEFTIVGVLPADFKFATEQFALWAPLGTDPNYRDRDDHNLLVFARLKDGVTLPQAQSEMDGVAQQLAREYPATSTGWGITVRPLQRFYSGVRNVRQTLLVLLAAVGFLLVIACANVANLLLARANARRKEIAVRLAVGATRRRLIRQLVTESVLLGVMGGATGFVLARLTFKSIMALAPYIPSFRPNAIQMDNAVLAFAMAVSIVASVAFGLAPALRVSRQDLNDSLREAGRGAHGAVRDRLTRRLLVASEIALAVVLLVGAGLLLASYRNLQTDRLGFNSDHVLVSSFCCLDETHYQTQSDFSAYYTKLFERLRELPGVVSVSGVNDLPLRQFRGAGSPFEIQGRTAPSAGSEPAADFFFIEPRYFETLQIPLLRGRPFAEQDDLNSTPVAIINATLAQRFWPDQDPIGHRLRPVQPLAGDPGSRWYRIIGVAADAKQRGLGTEPRPTIYRSYYQSMARYTFLVVRTRPDPLSMARAVQNVIASVDPRLPLGSVQTLSQQLAQSVSTQRFSMTLLGLFAGLALTLAGIGVYGVTAYMTGQRTHEVGVRMALGAQPIDIARLVIGEGLRLGLVGVAAGVVSALLLTRVIRNLLYGVTSSDPITFVVVSGVMVGITLGACYLPARRAARVDPIVTL
ncbi:MAG: ABC transporter permease, partial [Acidobacteria bacterium Pan2503]|nr:ABC transporter permease [Candidatus Acidoferrum panamensis]